MTPAERQRKARAKKRASSRLKTYGVQGVLSEKRARTINDAAFLRGAIITAYSQVEFLLADLILRCRERAEYAGMWKRYPYKLEDRIKGSRRLFDAPGPLAKWKPRADSLIEGLLEFEQIRHMMAHGLVIVKFTPTDDHLLEFRLTRPKGKDEVELGFMATNVEELDQAAHSICQYAQAFVSLWRDIYVAEGLEPII